MSSGTQTGAGNSPADANTQQTAAQIETQRKEAEAAEAERQRLADLAKSQATEQNQDLQDGGSGAIEGEAATGHSITDPKAAPVDYAKETMRRPNQRNLPPAAMSREGVGQPLVNLPYGSEPKSIDTATGGIIPVAPAKPEGDDAEDEGEEADVVAGKPKTAKQRKKAGAKA